MPLRLLSKLLVSATGTLLPADWRFSAGQGVLAAVFLADHSRSMVDAIGRTLVRPFVTQKRLLEWETSAATERRFGAGASQLLAMWPTSVLALLLTGAVYYLR